MFIMRTLRCHIDIENVNEYIFKIQSFERRDAAQAYAKPGSSKVQKKTQTLNCTALNFTVCTALRISSAYIRPFPTQNLVEKWLKTRFLCDTTDLV